jgi:hypothetical protein
MNLMTPRGAASFNSRATIWTILVEIYYRMFHVIYLTSGLCQFRGVFFSFYYIHKRETYDPRPGANFDTWGKIWTSLVKGLQMI